MYRKVLIVSLVFMSSFSLAGIETLAQVKRGKNEVKVQKIGESACTLTYKSGEHLTTEGGPVFYTFQVEVADGEIQRGMLSSIPHSIKPKRYSTLSFYDRYDKNIYEYSSEVSEYGQIFYSTNLFSRFLRSKKIFIIQDDVTKKMPLYSQVNIPNSVKKKFETCVSNLDVVLKKYCASSTSATKQCAEKKQRGPKAFAGLSIKKDPIEVAKAARIAKLKELEKAAKIAKNREIQIAKNREIQKAKNLKIQKEKERVKAEAKIKASVQVKATQEKNLKDKTDALIKAEERENERDKEKERLEIKRKKFMAACNNPTINESGPINKPLYIRGTFHYPAWRAVNKRAFKYKGNNTYQVVVDEKSGRYEMQYASKDWSLQFTTHDLALVPAFENKLTKGDYEKNTRVTLPKSGKYVWSLQFSMAGIPQKIMVSLCK